jgi:CMP-N-acetylneuraminic acid synthetase
MNCSKIKLFLVLMALLLVPSSSHAFFDFFRGNVENKSDKADVAAIPGKAELSECGRQIEIFKVFMHDGKICKSDDDCVSVDGSCPLGCKFYINKNFVQIINTEMDKVLNVCDTNSCSYKCPKINVKPVCKQNKCQARTK